MYQTFGATARPEQGPPRLAALRDELKARQIDVFLVPRADAHQGEYVAECDARLAWLTGFTGSAGFCAVSPDTAAVFVDGRYRLQVRAQIADVFTPVDWPETSFAAWLNDNFPEGCALGYDPWLHSVTEIADLRKDANPRVTFHPIDNPIDVIWTDRPAPPDAAFSVHVLAQAGESCGDKRKRLAAGLKARSAVLTLPDSIAWLLNIRGTDVPRNPVPHAFAVLHDTGDVDLFARPGKARDVIAHLGTTIRVQDAAGFVPYLQAMTGAVQIDPKSCPEMVKLSLTGAQVIEAQDPCILPKARKNATEIRGSKAAHLRDGVAMVQFLAWLDEAAPNGRLTEIDVVTALEGFRRDTNQLRDISFETICGAGPNGAIVHYRVTDDSNRRVDANDLLLVDSGGQYLDGTTDITRTVIVGSPQPEHRACYTRVLQGLVAISRVQFPRGVAGNHLDALARFPLWTAGMDYDHGTGHGVGSYLSVHEGPQGISRRATTPLEEGMILSNEPGYYRTGGFGIRIENLIYVVKAPSLPGADARDMLAFETLTYVPFDRRLIDTTLLSHVERDWINQYHADTYALLAPRLDGRVKDWLSAVCAPL